MEKDRKPGQNGKDGMKRPLSVSREEYENNYEKWLEGIRKQREQQNKKEK